MISNDLLLVLLLDAVVAVLVATAILKVERGAMRTSFVAFVLSMALWLNPLLWIRMSEFPMQYSVPVARVIFGAGVATLVSFGHFLTLLFQRPVRAWPYIAFQVNNLLLAGFIAGGLIIEDFARKDGQIVPAYGPLHSYFVASWAAFGLFLFVTGWQTYRRTTEEFLRFQIWRVFWTGLATFAIIITTNAILPRITGVSSFSHLGPLSTLIVFGGILRLLIDGRTLFLVSVFRRVAHSAAGEDERNLFELRQLLDTTSLLFEKQPERFERTIDFRSRDRSLVVRIVRGQSDERRSGPSPEGLLSSVYGLEVENQRLQFAVLKLEGALRHRLGAEVQPTEMKLQLPYSPEDGYDLQALRPRLVEHLREMHDLFGRELIAISPASYRLMMEVASVQSIDGPVVISGEPGTGRGLIAHCLHHVLGGDALREVSCRLEGREGLRQKIQAFLEGSKKGEGLLLRGVDAIASRAAAVLDPLLSVGHRVYLTVDSAAPQLSDPPDVASRLSRCRTFQTVPLRDRPEDVLFLTVNQLLRRGNPPERLSKQIVARLTNQRWVANVPELQVALDALATGREEEAILLLPPSQPMQAGLSPLELAERSVIERYLVKNRDSRMPTARALGISVNTLKAKIRKYGIVVRK